MPCHSRTRLEAGATMITARPWLTLAMLSATLVWTSGQAIQDSRCYLMSGGAVESFFISEDAAVGSVIGTLSVNGEPNEARGDITLSLQERDSPVLIGPGTKNITLARALDREDVTGPSSIYVNVRCDRRRTNDPSFVIPVSIRVTDVNDNAPVWQDTPYRVRLSELTAVGSRILQSVRATDADQPGPHATVEYKVLPGPNSDYFGFVNQLDSMLVVKKPLDYETMPNFTVTLRAQDQGEPPLFSDTELHVEILDADDQNPKFSEDHYAAILPDRIEEGMELVTSPSPVSAIDQDLGINAPIYYSLTGDNKDLFVVDKDSGRIFTSKELAEAGIDSPLTLVLKATQYDNPDRYALSTLTVTKRSIAGAPVKFTQGTYSAAVLENLPVGSVLMTLYTNQRQRSQLQYYVSDRSFLQKFAINSAGEVVLRKPLDFETDDSYQYQVMVTDGIANDTAAINITVININDWEPRFRYPQYEFFLDGDMVPGGLLVGKVEVFDGDKGDYITLTLRGPNANLFYINDAGEIFMREDSVSMLNSSAVHVVVTATDSGSPPRSTSAPVVVHIGESLMARGLAAAGHSSAVLVAVFGALLALLLLVVLLLAAYIYLRKRPKPSPQNGKVTSGFVTHEKLPQPEAPASNGSRNGNLAANMAGSLARSNGNSGSLLSVSAGASTILANSTSSLNVADKDGTRQSQRFPAKTRKVAPAPPGESSSSTEESCGVALMSDHLNGGGGRSGVAWPSSTIPARVKKLSWDDDEHKGTGAGEIHDATNPSVAGTGDHMNLTVYF